MKVRSTWRFLGQRTRKEPLLELFFLWQLWAQCAWGDQEVADDNCALLRGAVWPRPPSKGHSKQINYLVGYV